MLLRDHPLMSYKGNRSWPPRWLRTGGNETTNPKGEVGILKDVIRSTIEPNNRCFLIMEHWGTEYVGALLLSDTAFCGQTVKLLRGCLNHPLAEIGSIDLAYTL